MTRCGGNLCRVSGVPIYTEADGAAVDGRPARTETHCEAPPGGLTKATGLHGFTGSFRGQGRESSGVLGIEFYNSNNNDSNDN